MQLGEKTKKIFNSCWIWWKLFFSFPLHFAPKKKPLYCCLCKWGLSKHSRGVSNTWWDWHWTLCTVYPIPHALTTSSLRHFYAMSNGREMTTFCYSFNKNKACKHQWSSESVKLQSRGEWSCPPGTNTRRGLVQQYGLTIVDWYLVGALGGRCGHVCRRGIRGWRCLNALCTGMLSHPPCAPRLVRRGARSILGDRCSLGVMHPLGQDYTDMNIPEIFWIITYFEK